LETPNGLTEKTMRANEYVVMSECIEVGVRYGVRRAFKHTEEPSEMDIEREVEAAVMNAICEKFVFEPNEEDE
jgi:hypothetical protein